jgi:hypothetical protein
MLFCQLHRALLPTAQHCPLVFRACDNVPPVQVALRRRAAGKRDGVMAGETVPYVICLRQQQQQQQEGAAAGSAAVKQEEDGSQAQQQQQPAGAAAQEAAASPAAPKQQQQQDGSSSPAPAAASGSGVRTASAPAGGSNSSGGLAERAYHPDELRANPSLVVDAEYYLGQQVLPVVVRLCAPIEVRGWGGGGRGLCGVHMCSQLAAAA